MAANKLMNSFRSIMAKSKDSTKEADFDVLYPSGFLTLDFLNGTMVHVNTPDIQTDYIASGIVDGSSNTFIGRSGCGKSTLCTQIIGNMMKMFPTSVAFIDDIEGSLPQIRKEFLLGLSAEELENRVYMRNTEITTENVYAQIKMIHDEKINNRKEYEYDTGLYDTYGKRIYKLIPTFYFIDSFAMLMPNDIADADELDQGMGATKIAKTNTQVIKKISQLLKGANIILFTVNHILDAIQMGFMPAPAQIDGLQTSERLPGGKAALYLANNLIRLDEKTTLKETEGFGINGKVVNLTLIKSRTNATRRAVPMVFNKTEGCFDNVLSVFFYLKSEGAIGGAGKSFFLENAPDIKFSQKEFKSKLYSDPNLQKAFAELSKEYLSKLLSDTKNQESEEVKEFDFNSMVFSV